MSRQNELPEKRRRVRTRKVGPQQVTLRRLSGLGRQEDLPATLWDFSYGGLGIELPHALTPAEEVDVDANLQGEEYSVLVDGLGRVVHSHRVAANRYRVGISFMHVRYQRLDAVKPK